MDYIPQGVLHSNESGLKASGWFTVVWVCDDVYLCVYVPTNSSFVWWRRRDSGFSRTCSYFMSPLAASSKVKLILRTLETGRDVGVVHIADIVAPSIRWMPLG